MKNAALVVSLSLLALSADAWASPSRIQRAWHAARAGARAARAIMLRPKDSLNTLRNARVVLGRKVRLGEKISILAAHNTGAGRIDAQTGKMEWKPGVIATKARLLRSFTQAERRALFHNKVVGKFTMLVKPLESWAPQKYRGVTYPNIYEARRAMARYWRVEVNDIDIKVDSVGYRVLP